MLFATRHRLFHSRLLALLLAFGGLASSCQSSRSSFSFQPAPGRVRAAAMHSVIVADDSTAAKVILTASEAQPVARARGRTRLRPHAWPVAVVPVAEATITRPPVGRSATVRRRALLGRPRATAEVGLGTTVLGVLGLVALPIALVGLLLSGGGLVWGIVAGAAALAVLVAYIDPFG